LKEIAGMMILLASYIQTTVWRPDDDDDDVDVVYATRSLCSYSGTVQISVIL
jgi:hypothetical protein